jgi:hypothetical protein
MKNLDYYSDVKAKYLSYEERKAYEDNLINQINNEKLTLEERKEKLKEVKAKVREYEKEYNKEYSEQVQNLTGEFWQDIREELGYDQILNEDGCRFFESEAYERGHAYGFSSIYSEAQDLMTFLEGVVCHLKYAKG